MTEIILSISLLISLISLAVSQYLFAKERKDLIRAIISKNMTELNTAEAIKKMPKEEPAPPDLEPLSEVDDDRFEKMIKNQNKN